MQAGQISPPRSNAETLSGLGFGLGGWEMPGLHANPKDAVPFGPSYTVFGQGVTAAGSTVGQNRHNLSPK